MVGQDNAAIMDFPIPGRVPYARKSGLSLSGSPIRGVDFIFDHLDAVSPMLDMLLVHDYTVVVPLACGLDPIIGMRIGFIHAIASARRSFSVSVISMLFTNYLDFGSGTLVLGDGFDHTQPYTTIAVLVRDFPIHRQFKALGSDWRIDVSA